MDTLLGTDVSPAQGPFEDDFPFPKVGSASSLEGRCLHLCHLWGGTTISTNLQAPYSQFGIHEIITKLEILYRVSTHTCLSHLQQKKPCNFGDQMRNKILNLKKILVGLIMWRWKCSSSLTDFVFPQTYLTVPAGLGDPNPPGRPLETCSKESTVSPEGPKRCDVTTRAVTIWVGLFCFS